MNIINLINEERDRQDKKKNSLGIEATKAVKNAEEQFKRSQIVPVGTVQFMAKDVETRDNKIQGFRENLDIIHTPKSNTNLVEMLNIKVFEGVKNNFKMPLWNNTIYANDDMEHLPYYIYNESDTMRLNTKTTLEFVAKKRYINVAYSGEVLKAASTSIQDALTADALKQIYDEVLFGVLYENATSTTPQTATTKEDIITYLDGAKGQHKGIFVVGKTAFQTMLKMDGLINNNLIFGAIPYVVYVSKYLPHNATIYFNPDDVYLAQFGAFDMTVDNVTDRVKDIIHVHLEGYFDGSTVNQTNNYLIVEEPTDDEQDAEPASGDTESGETIVDLTSGTTEP